MKGTEKQIEWASSIKEGFITGLRALTETAERRVNEGNMPKRYLEITSEIVDTAILALNNVDNASQIIDIRKLDVAGSANQQIAAAYDNSK